jgi:hypothetical protein
LSARLWLAACALAGGLVTSASAAEAFIGRWAATPDICSTHGGATATTSALVATDTSLWWFDGYCRIGKMYKAKDVYVQAHCGSGDVPVTLAVEGDRMKVTWNHAKPVDMRRCK